MSMEHVDHNSSSGGEATPDVAVARPGVRRMRWGGREEGLSALLCGCLIALWIARFFGAFGGPVQVGSHLHG